MGLQIGQEAPNFILPGVDGKEHSLNHYRSKKIFVLIFTCNHSPYSQAYEDRLIALAKFYGIQGVQFVAINSNDPVSYPEDNFLEMKDRQRRKNFPYPYLQDKEQKVAREYGPDCTPDVFVLDRTHTLRYHGRIDDNWRHSDRVKDDSLKNAISTLLSGGAIPSGESRKPAIGSNIKWK